MKIVNENGRIQQVIITDMDSELKSIHQEYHKYFDEYKESFAYVNQGHPIYIPFEVNDYCNMHCKMCWRTNEANPNGKKNIDLTLLRKFVRDCNQAGVRSFFLGANTECLINPQILEIIKIIREDGNGIDDVLITNGYSLTEDICDVLIDYQWEKIFISLDAASEEVYKKIRGKDLTVVERNIELLLEKKEKRKSKLPFVRVSFVVMNENKHEMQQFVEKWKEKVDRIDFQTLTNPQNILEIQHDLEDPKTRCIDPFQKMEMDCEGNFYPCASLYNKYHHLGNIKDMSVEEVWNCDLIKKIRYEMLHGNLNDICKTCLHEQERNFVELQ